MRTDMGHQDLTPDCSRFQNELPGLLYDELAPDTRAALAEHLRGCAACSEELSALRDTQKLLARWETPTTGEDPRLLARAIAAQARASVPHAPPRGRLMRWSAMLSGAAAALLFGFSLLHAQFTLEDGRFQLSFGAPIDEPATAVRQVPWQDEMRTIVAEEVSVRTAQFEESQAQLLQRCSMMNKQELLRLSRAVDLALAQSQEAVDTRLISLGREAARADLETRRVVTDLASYLPR